MTSLHLLCQSQAAPEFLVTCNDNAECLIPHSPTRLLHSCLSPNSNPKSTLPQLHRLTSPLRAAVCLARAPNRSAETTSAGPALYGEFVDFSIHEAARHADLRPLPIQDGFKELIAVDKRTVLFSYAFESSKIRLFRVAMINGGESMQVLNMAIFPRPELDLPIFCADFFSTSTKHIILLDLNPLYDVEKNKDYKTKYYSKLMPLVNKYVQVLPWGQKLTTESLQFFSPIVIWTKLESRLEVQENVFSAFKEYLQVWLNLHDLEAPTAYPTQVLDNQWAQHRYLSWRATKDPGRPLMHRLFGRELSERYIDEFLFNGVKSLGTEGFLDYFPEYRCADGSIRKERSIVGKSCDQRPWDTQGNFLKDIGKTKFV